MPFPRVDIEEQVRIGAYHEATHMFFSMYYAYGLSGGVEIYDDGLGLAETRSKDMFASSTNNGDLFNIALEYVAPMAVEQIIIGNNSLAFDESYFEYEFMNFPSFEYPCDRDLVLSTIRTRYDGNCPDGPMAACALTIESILYGEQVKKLKNIELRQDQLFEHFLDEYESLEKIIFKTLSDESVILPICDLAENLYKSVKLSKDEVLEILKPHFIKEEWFFNDS